MSHVGGGMEHRCQGQLPPYAWPGHLQLLDVCGASVCGLDPSKAGSTHCSPACPHWPTYHGGPAAPANSGPAARPTLHWTAGDLPPGRGSMAAHPLPGLLMVDTGREDTAGRKGSTWSTDRPHHHFVTKPSGHAPTIKAYQDLCSGA